MDLYLTEHCPELIEQVTEALDNYGEYSMNFDPVYVFFGGMPSQSFVDRQIDNWSDEIEAAINFAGEYAVDLSEYTLDTPWDRFIFAIQYLAFEVQSDREYEKEQAA